MCDKLLTLTNVDSPIPFHLSCHDTPAITNTAETKETLIVNAKGDSAASDNYWRVKDSHCLSNVRPFQSIPIMLPDGDLISGNKKGDIPLHPAISNKAKQAKILPNLQSSSLISLGRLCDDDCKVELTKQNLIVTKNNKVVLQGVRNHVDKLWDIPIQKTVLQSNNCVIPPVHPSLYPSSGIPSKTWPSKSKVLHPPVKRKVKNHTDITNISMATLNSLIKRQQNLDPNLSTELQPQEKLAILTPIPEQPSLHVIIWKKQTKMELAKYLHACLLSPVTSTLLKAIKKASLSLFLVCLHP